MVNSKQHFNIKSSSNNISNSTTTPFENSPYLNQLQQHTFNKSKPANLPSIITKSFNPSQQNNYYSELTSGFASPSYCNSPSFACSPPVYDNGMHYLSNQTIPITGNTPALNTFGSYSTISPSIHSPVISISEFLNCDEFSGTPTSTNQQQLFNKYTHHSDHHNNYYNDNNNIDENGNQYDLTEQPNTPPSILADITCLNNHLINSSHSATTTQIFQPTEFGYLEKLSSTSPSNYSDRYFCTFPNCNKSFSKSYSLKSHLVCHQKEKMYTCACGSAFSRKH
ncbi:hypothetical protein HDU92_000840, partial [Lobulomyces angularis]